MRDGHGNRLLNLREPDGVRFQIRADDSPSQIQPQKLLCDLLKRQGRKIMADITECDALQLPAQLARLDDWRDVAEHLMRHDFKFTAEAVRSERQLAYPSTLADWCAVAELTRRANRAPAFINSRDAEIQKILYGIDQLAGLIARDTALVNFLAERGAL